MSKNVAEEFNELVSKSGMRKREIAKRLDITPPYLWTICVGKNKPSNELYERMIALRDRLKQSGLLEIA
jgi:predicted transcriptional regulator